MPDASSPTWRGRLGRARPEVEVDGRPLLDVGPLHGAGGGLAGRRCPPGSCAPRLRSNERETGARVVAGGVERDRLRLVGRERRRRGGVGGDDAERDGGKGRAAGRAGGDPGGARPGEGDEPAGIGFPLVAMVCHSADSLLLLSGVRPEMTPRWSRFGHDVAVKHRRRCPIRARSARVSRHAGRVAGHPPVVSVASSVSRSDVPSVSSSQPSGSTTRSRGEPCRPRGRTELGDGERLVGVEVREEQRRAPPVSRPGPGSGAARRRRGSP